MNENVVQSMTIWISLIHKTSNRLHNIHKFNERKEWYGCSRNLQA